MKEFSNDIQTQFSFNSILEFRINDFKGIIFCLYFMKQNSKTKLKQNFAKTYELFRKHAALNVLVSNRFFRKKKFSATIPQFSMVSRKFSLVYIS